MKRWVRVLLVAVGVGVLACAYVSSRALRVANVARDMRSQIRYLIENGGTIGTMPADESFSLDFLQAIFGDNPALLAQLQAVINRGLADEPALNVGEVAAMLVTYHMADDGNAEDVVVHAIGGFGFAQEKPGFHRNGYFFQQVDPNLWNYGNIILGFLGRDIVLFAADEQATQAQQALIDSMFSGEVTNLVEYISKPLYYTMVLPSPKNVTPPQLRNHVDAVIIKGMLSHYKGNWEVLVLTRSPKSAAYTMAILSDMKLAAEVTLKTRWHGVERQTLWGPVRNPWWAYEMVQTFEKSKMEKEENLVRMRSDYERVMVNAVLKIAERLSRDLAAMRSIQTRGMDPRLADAKLRTSKPLHYWSEPHQWGPDWPIAPPITNAVPEDTPATAPANAEAKAGASAVAANTP